MANIAVFYGSYRVGRLGVRAVRFVEEGLRAQGHMVSVVDAADYELGILEMRYSDYDAVPSALHSLHENIVAAEGFVIICGEYNASLQPGLSNLIDHFYDEYARKPAGIVSYSYGRYAGVRAAVQARALLAAVGLVAIPDSLTIAQISESLSEDGEPAEARLRQSRDRFLGELSWYVDALMKARKAIA